MKRTLFFVVMAVLSFSSCRKDDSVCLHQTGDIIGFSTYLEQSRTKAGVTDVTGDNLTSFKVMAYRHGTGTGYFGETQTAERQTSGTYDGYFTTADTYHWPGSYSLDFFAWSGSGADIISNNGSTVSLPYTVPDSGTEDFVVSRAFDCEKTSGASQTLVFSHALSKVNSVTLKAKNDGLSNNSHYRFVFTDVCIEDAKTTATYTFSSSDKGSWGTPGAAARDYRFTQYQGNFLGGDTLRLQHSAGVDDSFIILPQKALFIVTYSVEYSSDGSNWQTVMNSVTKCAYIEMTMGKSYDITLQLTNDRSPILFNVSDVDNWTPATDTETPAILTYIEGGTDYGPGIEVNGLVWAPVNCGIGGDYKYPYGLLYQWGRMDGQDYGDIGDNLVSGTTSAPDSSKFYSGSGSEWYAGEVFTDWPEEKLSSRVGNPCPAGWRVPTYDEWRDLAVIDPFYEPEVVEGTVGTKTVYGSYFDGTDEPGPESVFLPAAGYRSLDGSACERVDYGYYWADSRSSDGGKPWELLFDGYGTHNIVSNYSAVYGFSVRCVH